jgi:hypothetical protein
MYELMDRSPLHVVAVRGSGRITSDDDHEVLVPAVDRATAGGRKARLLVELGPVFEGYGPSAMMADAGLGIGHFGSIERIAVMTDATEIRDSLGLFGGLIPGEVRTFSTIDADAAAGWSREGAA